jgi:hypothetical protein
MNIIHLNIQFLIALVTFLLIFRIYLQPWFKSQPFGPAVLPLLLIHVFRYLGLTFLAPGQVEASVSPMALQIMAYGDLSSGVFALLAALAIAGRSSLIVPLVGLFTLVGLGDLIMVGYQAAQVGIVHADIGTMRFLMVTFAPVLLLSHIYIAYRLVSHTFRKLTY